MYNKSRHGNSSSVQPKISPVTLALQLPSGERLISEFHPEVSLWNILQHWETNKKLEPSLGSLDTDVPVCIYLRKEVSSIGVLQTTTLLNLGITNGKAVIRYFTKQPGVVEQLHVGGFIAPTPRPPSPEIGSSNKTPPSDPNEIQMEEPSESDMVTENNSMPSKEHFPGTNQVLVEDNSISEPTVTPAVAHFPNQEQNRPLKTSTEPEAQPIDIDVEEPVHFLNEHGVLVYLPPNDVNLSKQIQEESDEFFEHTEEEVRRMMQELISKNNQLQTAPLMTAQLRREQEEQRRTQFLAKYPTTVLRIQFCDRFVLQMPSPSGSTLAEVKQKVIQYLDVERDVDSFELFTTPPKKILETTLPLHQLGLTPSSHVYITSNCVLKEQFRLNATSYASAVRDAGSRLYRSNVTTDEEASVKDGQRQKRPASDNSSSNASSEKNVPKWLKLNR